jgi:type I restriction enzyme S subunit
MIAALKPYDDYKDTGLPWAPVVPKHWNSNRAKWLFTKMDRPVQEQDEVVTCFRDGMVTLRKNRRLRGFTEAIFELGYQGIRKGDLVIHAMDAFAGAIGVSDSDGKGTPVYAVCQPKEGINPYYYAHIVREMARTQWIFALSRGIRERSTDFRYDTFGGQLVPIPPPEEQEAIVRFLDHAHGRIDRAIRAKRKVIALLNEQKQAIIHKAVTRGLDPTVSLKPSGIPWLSDIPAHWEVRKVGSLFRFKGSGTTPSGDQYYGGSVKWVMSGDLNNGVVTKTKRTLTDAALSTYSTLKLYPADSLIIAMYGATIGKTGLLGIQACTNQACCVLVRPEESTDVRYVQYVIQAAKPVFLRQAYGGGQPNINAEVVKSLRIALPPKKEQEALISHITAETTTLDSTIKGFEREIVLLVEYRTRLTADVVTGKLDVREAAMNLPEESSEADADSLAPEEEELEEVEG